MKTIKQPKKVQVPRESLLLFDRANKRINRLEKAGIKFKQGASQFRATARAMGAQYGIKTNRLSMAKNMDEKYYNAQLQLARKIIENDAIYTVKGARKSEAEQRAKLNATLSERYPNLKMSSDKIVDRIIKYNEDNYESSFIQWLYESWKNNKSNPEDERGLMRLLDVAAGHGQTIDQTLKELDKLAHDRPGFSWQGLAREYVKKW